MMDFEEVAVLDRNAEALGVPTGELMENAGRGLADAVVESFPDATSVCILCGPGNNGGDGLVAARHLHGSMKVKVVLPKGREGVKTELSRLNLQRLPEDVEVVGLDGLDRALNGTDVWIDSLLGSGIHGSLRAPYRDIVARLGSGERPVLAVDIPTGMETDTPYVPHMTVTFHDVKTGMNEKKCGKIRIVDIGIPPDASERTGPGELLLVPRPRSSSHKNQNGRLLIIGGGPYTGAPALAAMAALRCGVDIVQVATPKLAHPVVAGFSPDLIVRPLRGDTELVADDLNYLLELAEMSDAVLAGPGLDPGEATGAALREFISKYDGPLALDAGAFPALAGDPSFLKGRKGVLTPHLGELARLGYPLVDYSDEARVDLVRKAARDTGMTVLLKGAVDLVVHGDLVKSNHTGNPAMTVGGTGDLLAGMVGAFLAKGMGPWKAARVAAYVAGSAGDRGFEFRGYSLVASDLLDIIPEVIWADILTPG